MEKEKKRVAFISVIAAVFLTGFKLIIGLLTGSLGILSEALHSGLDLIAAIITLFSVSISDKPSDEKHHFGHGKIENFSALIETILLIFTCFWIVYEAFNRLFSGKTEIEVNFWSYFVVISSIIIDYSRSRALYRVARKYNSQALEADALHFSTDIWSSAVVLLGLICAQFGLFIADSAAALVVACIVLLVSYKLGRKAMDVLLDKAPPNIYSLVTNALDNIPEILKYHDLKIRSSGSYTFIEVNIHVETGLTILQAHDISHKAEREICKIIEKCEVHVHTEPDLE